MDIDPDVVTSAALAVVRVLAYAALVALAFAPLERLWPRHTATASGDRRRMRCDAFFATAGALMVETLSYVVIGALLWTAEALPGSLGIGVSGPLQAVHPIAQLALALLLFELAGYGYHRAAHAWGPLWRLHAVHHSSKEMDWLASFRQHPLEIALMTAAQNLPLVLLGVPLGQHAVVVLLLRLGTVYVHSNLRVPRALELAIATPSFHHRHHDRDAEAANYAALLPWIDRLFGTFDGTEARRFGLASPTPSTFTELLLAPFRDPRAHAIDEEAAGDEYRSVALRRPPL